MNRLANETSPYLRQHRQNPVDWYPWGPAAFQAARDRDVPILLSVGYSACHWCHVMAHESFEDAEVADSMNSRFVCVKVDREERPDVDAIYMDAVQALTGRGGWPMTVAMDADGRPFWGGTYFPKAGFLKLLEALDHHLTKGLLTLPKDAGRLILRRAATQDQGGGNGREKAGHDAPSASGMAHSALLSSAWGATGECGVTCAVARPAARTASAAVCAASMSET